MQVEICNKYVILAIYFSFFSQHVHDHYYSNLTELLFLRFFSCCVESSGVDNGVIKKQKMTSIISGTENSLV